MTQPVSLILFCGCILVCILFLLYFRHLVSYANQKTEKLLLLFLDIPRKNLSEIYKQCEKFVKFSNKFSIEKQQQKNLILLSSDDETELDRQLEIKLQKLKKSSKGGQADYFYYLVSRDQIVSIFRRDNNKQKGSQIAIGLISFLCLIFGLLRIFDFTRSNQDIISLREITTQTQNILSWLISGESELLSLPAGDPIGPAERAARQAAPAVRSGLRSGPDYPVDLA